VKFSAKKAARFEVQAAFLTGSTSKQKELFTHFTLNGLRHTKQILKPFLPPESHFLNIKYAPVTGGVYFWNKPHKFPYPDACLYNTEVLQRTPYSDSILVHVEAVCMTLGLLTCG